ncbi:MAG: SDR family NAD(P)-dependent oxidoreductase [Planctomycetia bacterium]|nr:SDR family NAD(P)-dependent oxidoreductase [Planctomycetia bacterium]
MSTWQGKVALVTGGSGGLGRAIAAEFVKRGAQVVIAARGAEKLEAVADELRRGGAEVVAVPADITRQEDVDALVAKTVDRFGRLDVLVNNAGRSARGEAIATSAEEFAELMNLNLIALVRCTRAAMPQLLANRGHLVNIGSLAGKTAARYMGAYSATKFAVSAYSQQLRLELGPQGLHVLLVSPGPIARDEPRAYSAEKLASLPPSARKPGGGAKVGLLRADKLAEQILNACERRKPELVAPGRARLVFAITQLWPTLGDWIVRKMS